MFEGLKVSMSENEMMKSFDVSKKFWATSQMLEDAVIIV